jgi:hypothetical protein
VGSDILSPAKHRALDLDLAALVVTCVLCLLYDVDNRYHIYKSFVHVSTTTAATTTPPSGMRHVYTWSKAGDVNKKSVNRNLTKGLSLAICPGGAHEVRSRIEQDRVSRMGMMGGMGI